MDHGPQSFVLRPPPYNRLVVTRARSPNLAWSSPLLVAGAAIGLGLAIAATAVFGSPLVALAGLLGGVIALALFREPALGLYALVSLAYLLPFAVIPVRLGGQVTGLEALLGLMMVVTLVRALVRREHIQLGPPGWLLLAVLGLATFSFLLSLPYTGSIPDVGRKFFRLALAMLVFPLTMRLITEVRQVESLLRVLMLCAALEAALSLYLYSRPPDATVRLLSSLGPLGYPTGPEVLRYLPGENDTYSDVLRATGSSIDPNVLGGALMLAAAIMLSRLFSPQPLLARWALAPLSALTVAALVLSHSRSAWLGLAVALLALAVVRYRRLWLVLAPAALALMLVPVGRSLYGRVVSGFAGQDKAAAMRFDEYRNALEIVQQHPIFGIGFGAPPAIDLAPGVSSQYLTVAETMGLPALLLYLAVLAWLVGGSLAVGAARLLRCPKGARLQPVSRVVGPLTSLQTALFAALVAGLFDHYFASTSFPHMVALFWFCCALLWRTTTEFRVQSSEFRVANRQTTDSDLETAQNLLLRTRNSELGTRRD